MLAQGSEAASRLLFAHPAPTDIGEEGEFSRPGPIRAPARVRLHASRAVTTRAATRRRSSAPSSRRAPKARAGMIAADNPSAAIARANHAFPRIPAYRRCGDTPNDTPKFGRSCPVASVPLTKRVQPPRCQAVYRLDARPARPAFRAFQPPGRWSGVGLALHRMQAIPALDSIARHPRRWNGTGTPVNRSIGSRVRVRVHRRLLASPVDQCVELDGLFGGDEIAPELLARGTLGGRKSMILGRRSSSAGGSG